MTTIMSDVIAGRIELLDPLARGASGSLWRAIDRRYGAVCAAKVMRQRDGSEVMRFVREQAVGDAEGLGAHPHLLPPYSWVAEDDTVVLVMPLVHGGTLASALAAHGALSPALVAHLLRQLLDALAAMHASHWVHRDVKPANLLLDATGTKAPHLLLADFGIALHEHDVRLTETGLVPGTPGFLAPEVIAGLGSTAAQDVWAAGACALQALDPRSARDRPSPRQALARAQDLLSRSSDPTAPGLAGLLGAILAEDPAQRPSAAAARDAIPVRTELASLWSRTADGRQLDLTDQLARLAGQREGLREVPLDGPAALAGFAPGLHERLSALAAPRQQSPVDLSPADQSPTQPSPSPAAPATWGTAEASAAAGTATPTTEGFVPVPTAQEAPVQSAPVQPAPVESAPTQSGSAQSDAARGARRHPVLGTVLLALSVLSLSGAGALWWAALG